MSTRPLRELKSLTSVRGIAALAVVLFHLIGMLPPTGFAAPNSFAGFLFERGWMGADLFFVLSGFVLAAPFLASAGQSAPAFRWKTFLARRWVRVAPPYYVAIVLAAGMAGTWALLWERPATNLSYLLFYDNLIPDGTDHYAPVFWTLAIEFQFYLLFPILIRGMSGPHWRGLAASLFGMSVAWLFFTYTFLPGEWDRWGRIQILAFLGHFALGMAAARIWRQRPTGLPRKGLVGLGFLTLGVVVPLLLWRRAADLAYPDLLLQHAFIRPWVAIGCAGVIWALAAAEANGRRLLHDVATYSLGKISYSLYLVHFPLMAFVGRSHLELRFQEPFLFSILVIVGSLALAAIFYLLVEGPATRRSKNVRWERTVPASAPSPTVEAPPASTSVDSR